MRGARLALGIAALVFAASAHAELKVYNSTPPNGLPGDSIRHAINLCPPVVTTLGRLGGQANLVDDGSGTVTLEVMRIQTKQVDDLGPDLLVPIFGPAAFIFIDDRTTTEIGAPHVGAGDSAPGGQITWGVISGWVGSRTFICLSSPVGICGCGIDPCPGPPPFPPSATYDLGTWNFDAVGDYQAQQPYILRTSNGGIVNTQSDLRGVFVGASLPALPLVGLGALAACLAVAGSRRLRR